jgi:hypothetical protein
VGLARQSVAKHHRLDEHDQRHCVLARERRGVAAPMRTKMFQSRERPTGRKDALHFLSAVQRLKRHGVRILAACSRTFVIVLWDWEERRPPFVDTLLDERIHRLIWFQRRRVYCTCPAAICAGR